MIVRRRNTMARGFVVICGGTLTFALLCGVVICEELPVLKGNSTEDVTVSSGDGASKSAKISAEGKNVSSSADSEIGKLFSAVASTIDAGGNATREYKKVPGKSGVLGSYLVGIGSESLANTADKIKPPPPSITRRPVSPPLNIGSVWNKNKNIGGGVQNSGNTQYGGAAAQGQGGGGSYGVRRRRPRTTQAPFQPAFQPEPDYYDLPTERPPVQGGGGFRPPPAAAHIPPPNTAVRQPPVRQPPPPPARPAATNFPPSNAIPLPSNKPLTDEQKLALHYLQLLEEKDREGGGAPPPPPPIQQTTRPSIPILVDVATTPEYYDYDPDYPDRFPTTARATTTTMTPPTTVRRRRRRSTTTVQPSVPAPFQQNQGFYPPNQPQPAYNPYFPPPQPQAPPAYYPPPQQQQPPFAAPLTPAQFQQLQHQQQPGYVPPQYQQPVYVPPHQPYYPPPQQQQQPYYPQPGYVPQQPLHPGYNPQQQQLSPLQVTTTPPPEEYDYIDAPITTSTTSTTVKPLLAAGAAPSSEVVNPQYQAFLQYQRLQQIKLLLELQRIRQMNESTTVSSENASSTEDPYEFVPRLIANPRIPPTRLTSTTDNPNDAVQGLANLFGSLAVGNLAGVVDGSLKFAGTGVFNNLNTHIACSTQGKCGEDDNSTDPPTEEPVPPKRGSSGGGILAGLFGGGNKGQQGGKKNEYVPHPYPQHPYPGRKPSE